MSEKKIISTPGRICLFGEHQDYLNLPVIASAISRRINVIGTKSDGQDINIALPEIKNSEEFSIVGEVDYTKERDYFRSAVNVLMRKGYTFSTGFNCYVKGKIPINAGASSSSALVVSWINFLAQNSDQQKKLSPEEIAKLAHEAEVLEFKEPGGMMDHYTTAIGGIIHLDFMPELKITKLNPELEFFVLGDSQEPKDTKEILQRVKTGIFNILTKITKEDNSFSLNSIPYEELNKYSDMLDEEEMILLDGTVRNRDITHRAFDVLNKKEIDHHKFGELLNQHHAILRDVLKISTPKIESMINAALDAGAFGAKINGSGGGGSMFAYAPEYPEHVFMAVKMIAEAYVIHTDSGTTEVPENEWL